MSNQHMKSVPTTTPARSFMATVVERTIYRATINSDDMEGRGSEMALGTFIDPALAHKAASKVITTLGYTVTIDGKVYAVGEEITLQDTELVLDAALSKIRAAGLSPEEARALRIQL